MSPAESRRIHYDGLHCTLSVEQPAGHVIVLRISGSDVGEFGEAPMQALTGWFHDLGAVDFFVDARDVRGASIDVSAEWAGWMVRNKSQLRSVTMVTGSRFIQLTAEFVRRFAGLEGIMRICTDPRVFDAAFQDTLGDGPVSVR
jgi:hypothetical protein